MKRLCILFFCCFAFMLNSGTSVFAGEISEELISAISENLDNIFPQSIKMETFDRPVGESRDNIGPATALIAGTADGARNILLYVNTDGQTGYLYEEKLNTGILKNFYYSIDVIVNDIYPSGAGGCGVGYGNNLPGYSADSEFISAGLLVSDAVYLETRDEGSGEISLTRLAPLEKNEINLTVIRLMGETFFYADEEFIGHFHDGKQGPFQLFYSTEAFSSGESAECSFDNINVRKVNP